MLSLNSFANNYCIFAVITLKVSRGRCYQNLAEPSSYLLPENFPAEATLPSRLKCFYTILVPLDWRIALHWEYFDLSWGCNPASIEVDIQSIFSGNANLYYKHWVIRPLSWLIMHRSLHRHTQIKHVYSHPKQNNCSESPQVVIHPCSRVIGFFSMSKSDT